MAAKKDKPAAASAGKGTTVAARPAPSVLTAPQGDNDTQRLLREAAWSRMFGRTESKNPFARSR